MRGARTLLPAALLLTGLVFAACEARHDPEASGDPVRSVPDEAVHGDLLAVEFVAGLELDEELAKQLYPPLRSKSRRLFDPVAHLLNAPDGEYSFEWPEHPRGRIVIRTNNLGLRDDEPTAIEKRGHRTLVLGDSHTEGAVANAEGYVHALEQRLAARGGRGAPYEALNAGVGGTGPFAYLGVLRHFTFLAPDLVIATIFTGNDFANALTFSDMLTGRAAKPRSREYMQRLEEVGAEYTPVPQGFNQAYYAKYDPDSEPLMVRAVLVALDAMAAHCAAHGADFAVVLIPTKADVDLVHGRDRVRAILEGLGLDEQDYAVNTRMAQALVAALQARGVPVVDPTTRLRADGRPLYWESDHHLNPAGQRLLAAIVFEELGARIP